MTYETAMCLAACLERMTVAMIAGNLLARGGTDNATTQQINLAVQLAHEIVAQSKQRNK